MVAISALLATTALALVQAVTPAPAPGSGPAPIAPPPESAARSKPPAYNPEPGQGPIVVQSDSAPATSADTRATPPPKVGALTAAEPITPSNDSGAGITAYAPAYFTEYRPTTAMDMVSHLPGFSEDDGDSVRGYSGAAGNVLIDGRRPASKSDSVGAQLSRMNASDVDHIELIRGGANGIDMQGRTVLANVVRRKGDSTQVVAQAGIHVFEDGHHIPGASVMATKRWDGRTLDLTVSRSPGLDDSVGDGRYVTRDGSGALTRSVPAKTTGDGGGVAVVAAYKGPLAAGDLRVNAKVVETYFKSSVDYDPGAVDDDLVSDRQRQRQAELGANYERKIGKVDVEAVLLQRLERDFSGEVETAPAYEAQFSQVNKTGESIARLSGRYSPWKKLTLEVGAEGAYNFLEGHTRFTQDGANVPLPSADVRVEEVRGEFFGQATYRPFSTLTLEAGVRFETSDISETGDATDDRSFFYAKPRFTLAWDLSKDAQLRLRVEKKVGQLDFGSFVSTTNFAQNQINAGNPDLRPDQRWQYEAALERRFWSKGSVVVTATHEEITDVVDLIPIVGPGYAFDAPGNIGSGTADTIDIQSTLPLDKLHLKGGVITASATWRVSEVTDPVTGERRRISSQRRDGVNLGYTQDLPRWNSNVGINYYHAFTETAYRLAEVDHRIITPPFVQLFGEYKPRGDLVLHLELTNLIPFKFKYQQDLYAGPRNVSPLVERAELAIQSQPRLYFRIRKTFQ